MMHIPSRDLAEESNDKDAAKLDPHSVPNDTGEKVMFLFIPF